MSMSNLRCYLETVQRKFFGVLEGYIYKVNLIPSFSNSNISHMKTAPF